MKVTFEDVKKNKAVQTYIRMADESLHAMGYTEHGFAHVERVAETAREILLTLGYSEREAELASIAGYLHDIGNVVNREGHAQSGAVMAFISSGRNIISAKGTAAPIITFSTDRGMYDFLYCFICRKQYFSDSLVGDIFLSAI